MSHVNVVSGEGRVSGNLTGGAGALEDQARRVVEVAGSAPSAEVRPDSLRGRVEGSKEAPKQMTLEEGLKVWVDQGGDDERAHRRIAVEKILHCYRNNGTYLDLSRLCLTTLPPEIGSLTTLMYLNLSNTQLTSIPEEISSLTNLASLDLSDTPLSSLPKAIGSLTNLRELYLSRIPLTSLPDAIGSLTNLESLILLDTPLTSIPEEISLLTNLRNLNLSGTPLSSLPKAIGSLTNLRGLYLSRIPLTSLPDAIGSLTDLEILELSHTPLTSLPEAIGSLTNLRELCLSGTPLTSLPKAIGSLTNLELLELSHTPLTSLPEAIGSLINLENLYLRNTGLTSLPEAIGSLTNLRRLHLSRTPLTSLPEEVRSLTNLEYLDLSHAQLSSLPEAVLSLTNLEYLDLSHNSELAELPITLGSLSEITDLRIEGTQIPESIRDAILEASLELKYAEESTKLEPTIRLWSQYAGDSSDLEWVSTLMGELREDEDKDEHEKSYLYAWLTRLARSSDFKKQQKGLSKIVCNILQSVLDPSFRELCFLQMRINNECCQDRAAMALNELYVSWSLLCDKQERSLAQKIDLIERGGKTLALRSLLSHAIDQRQKKTVTTLEESVEIYLYFETLLKNKLNLLTAIETMSYAPMGNVNWIEEGDLISGVNKQYLDFAVDLPVFDTILDDEAKQTIDQIRAHYSDKLVQLGDRPAGGEMDDNVLNWKVKFGQCQADCAQEIKDFKKKWLIEHRDRPATS